MVLYFQLAISQLRSVFNEIHNYVLIFLDKLPKNISAETDLSPRAKAIKDHNATNSDELNFKVINEIHTIIATNFAFNLQIGDLIYLLDKVDGGEYLEGELNNKVGKFPSSYVEIIMPLP